MFEAHDTCLIDERMHDGVGEPDVQKTGDLRADAPGRVLRCNRNAGISKERQDEACIGHSRTGNDKLAHALIDCARIQREKGG